MTKNGHALRWLSGAVSVLLVTAACQDVTKTPAERGFAPTLSRSTSATPARHVFVMNGGVPSDFSSRVTAAGGTIVNSMDAIGVVVTEGLSDSDATALAGQNSVAPDYVAQWIPSSEQMQLTTMSLAEPVDMTSTRPPASAAFLPLQWNMSQVSAPQAWLTGRTGSPSVRVAILDTGLDPYHLDQRGLIDVAASTAFVPSTLGPPAWTDDVFHGTMVGSIVTSNDVGVAGVAPNVTLIAVKVLGANGTGSFSNVIGGIYYATDVAKAQIINMSLGAHFPKNIPGASTLLAAMNRAINHAHSAGVLVVSAAGNDSTDLQHDRNFVDLPCEAGVQMCVSATGAADEHPVYSNYGVNSISVAAPGGDGPPSTSTWIIGPCSSRVCGSTGSYVIAIGTSFSAPHVAGLAAYLDSQAGGLLNASQLTALIQKNATDLGKPGADPYFGKGEINVLKTISASQP